MDFDEYNMTNKVGIIFYDKTFKPALKQRTTASMAVIKTSCISDSHPLHCL